MREGWTYRKLGEICESDLGKTLNQSKDIGDLCPYLCAVNIQWDHVDLVTLKTARFSDIDKQKYSVKKGDLLVCEGGDIGRAAIWDKDGTMQYQNALHRIRFIDHTYCPRFYLAYLRYLKNKGVLDSRYGKGVTIQHLVKSSLLSIPVPVPPLPEQERIVAELDLLSGIIDKQKAQLKELDTLAQSIFYDMFGDPVENEKGWETSELKVAAPQVQYNGTIPDIEGKYWLLNLDMIAQQTGEIIEKAYFPKVDIGNSTITFDTSNVLYSKLRPYLNKVSVPDSIGYGTSELVPLKPNPSILNRIFFAYLLRSKAFVDFISIKVAGAKMPRVSMDILRGFPVILPPMPLQHAFICKIQSIESLKASINQSIAETQKLFDSAMDKYFG